LWDKMSHYFMHLTSYWRVANNSRVHLESKNSRYVSQIVKLQNQNSFSGAV
jgi:hypothetical protein